MKAPKCRNCGKEHWGSCVNFEVLKETISISGKKPRSPILKRPDDEVCPHCGKKLSDPVAKGFDKVKYQREYMRKRREKKV